MNVEKERLSFSINGGYETKLNIKYDDINNDLYNVCEAFLNKLEIDYKVFINNFKKEEEIYKKIALNKDVFFKSEAVFKKSPMTIINSHSGNGKTYLVEKVISNFKNYKDINTNSILEKIIIIDVLKYANSENIIDEVMAELFWTLSSFNKKIKLHLEKVARHFFNINSLSWIRRFGVEISKLEVIENDIQREEMLKNTSKNLPKTIVFFDNVDKVTDWSWKIISAIFKISEIENFLFILPVNINNLMKFKSNINEELEIEKYLDIGYYSIEQDYIGLLTKLGFKFNEIDVYNKILSTKIGGEKLSIREAEHRIKNNIIVEEKNPLVRMIRFTNCVWGNKDQVSDWIINKAKQMVDFINAKPLKIYNEYLSFISEDIIFENIIKEKIDKSDYFAYFDENNEWKDFDPKNAYNEWFEKTNKLLLQINEDKKSKMNYLKSELSYNISKQTKIDENIEEIEQRIIENQNTINNERKNEVPNENKILECETVIKRFKRQKEEKNLNWKVIESDNERILSKIQEINDVCNWNFFGKLDDLVFKYKLDFIDWLKDDVNELLWSSYNQSTNLILNYSDDNFPIYLAKEILEM